MAVATRAGRRKAPPSPILLTDVPRLQPSRGQAESRSASRSRSPEGRAAFRAQHLDPLLRNLSPESTLDALQATRTIQQGSAQGILARSIADASPAEREIGIRAAFAAQKLREFRDEVSRWEWPNARERARGAGFDPAVNDAQIEDTDCLGCLPVRRVDHYEHRIGQIRDGLDSLDMDEIKDHVLAAHSGFFFSKHVATATATAPDQQHVGFRGSSYGRLRDFTALITATVIQALPDLAVLTNLLDTWEIRLRILRQLPDLLHLMDESKRRVQLAAADTRDGGSAAGLTQASFDQAKKDLGACVAQFGRRLDRFLDMLEGQEDALPHAWIDSLETVELQYATWVVDAQRIIHANQAKTLTPDAAGHSHIQDAPLKIASPPPIPDSADDPSAPRGHRRDISDVSIANSAYSAISGISGISEAEIVEATQTQVLPSPKVSLIDHSNSLPTAVSILRAKGDSVTRSPNVQRASTASFELVSRDQLKKVTMRRSMSAELLTRNFTAQSSESTPNRALHQLTSNPSSNRSLQDESPPSPMMRPQTAGSNYGLNGHSLSPVSPILPRRSSKRASRPLDSLLSPSSGTPKPDLSRDGQDPPRDQPHERDSPRDQPLTRDQPHERDSPRDQPLTRDQDQSKQRSGTLEAKIQDILSTLPTKIRLAADSHGTTTPDLSPVSTRASTPTPALTLSPAKHSRNQSGVEPDVRLFHLHQHGQSRDVAPIKLHVRAVGENGERVMVRVGGGWADLGEYLREYSAHHRSKSVGDGVVEVAQYPSQSRRENTPTNHGHVRKSSGSLARAARRRSTSQTSADSPGGGSRGRSSRSPSPPPLTSADQHSAWTPPPVPPIPALFSTVSSSPPTQLHHHHSYTPLGAAGPRLKTRRSVTLDHLTGSKKEEAWVSGMLGKARAVSHGTAHSVSHMPSPLSTSSTPNGPSSSTIIGLASTTGPTTPSSASSNRQQQAPAGHRATGSLLSRFPSPPTPTVKAVKAGDRHRPRLSLGDVGGIKRVFLRKKSEK
ncbi:hypothetical protein DV735_g2606, partial [Chaetothyriales sp. CBS 134920]